MTNETTQSNGAEAPKIVVETYESVFGPKEEARAEEKAEMAAEAQEESQQQGLDDGNSEEESATSAEHGEEEENPAKKAKAGTPKGVQKRLDELTKQREEYRRQTEQLTRVVEQLTKGEKQTVNELDPAIKPSRANFQSDDAYIEALTDWKADQAVLKHEAQRQRSEMVSRIDNMEAKARKAHEDYDDAVRSFSQLGFAQSDLVKEAIMASEYGAEIAYRIGSDSELAEKLGKLPAHRLGFELAKLEDEIAEPPKPVGKEAKPVSKAPPPPGQIVGGAPVIDPMTVDAPHVDESVIAARVAAVRKRYLDQGKRPPY